MTNPEIYAALTKVREEAGKRLDVKLMRHVVDALEHVWYMLLDENEKSEALRLIRENEQEQQ